MPHPDTLPAGFTHWPHIRRIAIVEADAIIAQAEAEGESVSTYSIAAQYGAVLIGSSQTYHYFLVNRPQSDALPGDFVCEAFNDLSSQIRGNILEAEYEADVDGETVTLRCKENAVPDGVTPTRTGLIPSWVAGLPVPEPVP